MPMVSYSVLATFTEALTAAEYADWLTGGHVQAILQAGAVSAQVTRLDPLSHSAHDPEPIQILAEYLFTDLDAFDRYVQDQAPRLRAESAERFGSRPGISFQRRQGSVILSLPGGVKPS